MNAIVAPPAVTVTVCAVSGAVSITVAPVVAESVRVPAVEAQVVLPAECVSVTRSPTPIVVRVRTPGDVATVSLVIVAGAGGVGVGGVGVGGIGVGGVGVGGVGGVGVGGVGPLKRVSSAPIVWGPTSPSIVIPEAC